MVKKYNKLVRDNMPEIIKEQGNVPVVEILEGENYFDALNKKLAEEIAEYFENYNVEELVDIVEVVYAIVKYNGLSLDDFNGLRLKKYGERGGFDNRISLIEIKHSLAE